MEAGDADALGLLWRQLNPALLRYLRGRGAPAPDDLAAEIWVEVAMHLARVRGDEAGFRRFLFTVARHRLIDDFRRAARRPDMVADLPDAPAGPSCETSGGLDPETAAIAREELEHAVSLIRRLPPEQCEALLLRVIGGFDVADTAQIMGRPAGSVRVLTHRALRALRVFQDELVTERRRRSEIRLS